MQQPVKRPAPTPSVAAVSSANSSSGHEETKKLRPESVSRDRSEQSNPAQQHVVSLQERAEVSTMWTNGNGDSWALSDLQTWRGGNAGSQTVISSASAIDPKDALAAMKQKQREVRRMLLNSPVKTPRAPRR
eukprot:INCI11845.1.p1 GENE.INCI11845.1~~INCI11845.1.p1  ORF type:complete len:132 (-),score=21.24 INCI11845.1:96-491(-)